MKPSFTLLLFGVGAFALVVLHGQPAPGLGEWRPLFDGQSTAGWHNFGTNVVTGKGWVVTNGCLLKVAGVTGGDIVSDGLYEDFELEWEWRIPPGANNGIKYFIRPDAKQGIGHEYQMADNATMTRDVWRTAGFYEVLAPSTNAVPRIGEWNSSRLVVRGNHVEHWLNGSLALAYECGSAAVKAGVAKSKFKNQPGFGDKVRGRLLLTDHKDECTYRNVRLKELSVR